MAALEATAQDRLVLPPDAPIEQLRLITQPTWLRCVIEARRA